MSKHSSPFIAVAKDCPPNQFNLPLPDGLEDQLNPEQAKKVSKVQVNFAHGVGELLTKSYGEVSEILDDKTAKPVPASRPSAAKPKAGA
jgi:hypothetical protein